MPAMHLNVKLCENIDAFEAGLVQLLIMSCDSKMFGATESSGTQMLPSQIACHRDHQENSNMIC